MQDPIPSPPSPPAGEADLRILERELRRDWAEVVEAFRHFHELPPHRRFRWTGRLFHRLCPWLERGIQSLVVHHYVLVPTERFVAHLFFRVVEWPALPDSHLPFLSWVHDQVLRGLADPSRAPRVGGALAEEPPLPLIHRFNALPRHERAVLYLSVIEGCSDAVVASQLGMTPAGVRALLPGLWARLGVDALRLRVPHGWRVPLRRAEGAESGTAALVADGDKPGGLCGLGVRPAEAQVLQAITGSESRDRLEGAP